ncbi:MAG: retroviral-like aspartic protease family protein [Nitrososphaerales archaeon]
MIAYSTDYDPPAPVIPVVIQSPFTRRKRRMAPALIDTGADVTAVPEAFVTSLELPTLRRLRVAGLENEWETVETYSARVRLEPRVEVRVEVIASTHDFVILGRDVLNQLKIQLDGPGLTTEILAFQPSLPGV